MGFFGKCFGPSKDEIWSKLAKDLGAEFHEGSWKKQSALVAKHGEWTLVLDNYVVSTGQSTMVFTRMRAPFVNRDGLYFRVTQQGFFSGVGKFFGMQDIELGTKEFDDAFVIQGSDELKIKELLNDESLQQLLHQLPNLRLDIRDDEGWFGPDFPEDVDELCLVLGGQIRDLDQLKAMFELFTCLLERLVQIDSAYEDDPNIDLRK